MVCPHFAILPARGQIQLKASLSDWDFLLKRPFILKNRSTPPLLVFIADDSTWGDGGETEHFLAVVFVEVAGKQDGIDRILFSQLVGAAAGRNGPGS